MVINFQNMFFKSNPQVIEKNEFRVLAEITNPDNYHSNKGHFKKPRLSAIWYEENGKILCKWIVS
jgi:hypothetical protein